MFDQDRPSGPQELFSQSQASSRVSGLPGSVPIDAPRQGRARPSFDPSVRVDRAALDRRGRIVAVAAVVAAAYVLVISGGYQGYSYEAGTATVLALTGCGLIAAIAWSAYRSGLFAGGVQPVSGAMPGAARRPGTVRRLFRFWHAWAWFTGITGVIITSLLGLSDDATEHFAMWLYPVSFALVIAFKLRSGHVRRQAAARAGLPAAPAN